MFAFEHCATAAGNTVRQASDTPASLVIAKDDLGIPVFAADASLARFGRPDHQTPLKAFDPDQIQHYKLQTLR
ncbi:hypothetical protein [Synechococcus sp. MIT S1220]|uniref:hypothetical protein n=1 Tax=Synechococcus sp. MIT S1220 TaxID=3082549 RepID=UPI0039AFD8FC